MKSIQQVLWRGALALGLVAIGVGSSLGMPPAGPASVRDDCPPEPRALVADTASNANRERVTAQVVPRRPLTPAG